MKTIKKAFLLLSALPMAFIFSGGTLKAEIGPGSPDDEPMLVGRISYIEGQLFRYQPGDEDWTPSLEDTPFGAGENLYTEGSSRAEIILPNGTWARIDGGTQIQLVQLRDDLTELDLSSGTGRFYNKGAYCLIKVRTVFGDVTAPAGAAFDMHLYSNAVEVIALKGTVAFSPENTGQRYEVTAGLGSVVADADTVSVGKGYEPPGWDSWNMERDALWAERMTSGEVSAAYLPPSLRDEAYALDENGVWEGVDYANGYYYFWRPTHVAMGWSPFTVGCWTTWYHENTWVPRESFGYVTHHYGNWVFMGNSWYWAPPVARMRPHVQRRLLNIGFAWYPGRVAWIHFGINVGWVPLAPHEPYYAHHRWGQRVVVVKEADVSNLNVRVTGYKNYRHAVVIAQNDLYRVNNYRELRLTRVDQGSIAGNYHVVPTLGRIASKPVVGINHVPNSAKPFPEANPYSMFAGKTGMNRLEKVPGLHPPAVKTREPARIPPRERAQIQPRNAEGRVLDSGGPNVIRPPATNQYKTIGIKPRAGLAPATPLKQRITQTSLKTSQGPGARAVPRRVTPEVSRSNWPVMERKLPNPASKATLGPKSQSAGIRKTTDAPRAGSGSSFFGAKGGASENRNMPEQNRQTQLTTKPRTPDDGSGSKGNWGASRIQPSSSVSMGKSNRGFFRN